jgi:hypothetical protein
MRSVWIGIENGHGLIRVYHAKLSTFNLGEGILNVENRSRLKWGNDVLDERRLKGGIKYRMLLQDR